MIFNFHSSRKPVSSFFGVISAVIFLGFTVLSAQQVSGLKAWHKNGQTFIIWDNIPAKNITYRIYRSSTQINSIADLSDDNLIGSAGDSSSFNRRLHRISGRQVYFRIDSAKPPLLPKTGLFVNTIVDRGNFYYAVMVSLNNKVDKRIFLGQNSLMSPVFEQAGAPLPVWQTNIDFNGFKHEVYVHWTADKGLAFYPAMGNTNSHPYNFSLIRIGNPRGAPLVVALHQFGESFLSTKRFPASGNLVVLCPDDYMPNGAINSFWFGYHEKYNITGSNNIPNGGVVQDYTVRRISWYLDWVNKYLPIDRNSIYLYGGSMGGAGSVFLAMAMPSKIAAVYAVVPKFDYSFINDPNAGSIYNEGTRRRQLLDRLWGTLGQNLTSNDGIGVYDRLNAGVLSRLFEEISLPYIVAFNGKNDHVVGWAEKTVFYKNFQAGRQGGVFFWDDRDHNTGGIRHWKTIESPEYIFRFKLNRSFPAFSNCSANSNPGNGNADDGDVFGSINGFLDWDDNIRDEPDLYEISIRTRRLAIDDSVLFPPQNITTDVTPRRLQRFGITAGARYKWLNIDSDGRIIQSGIVRADSRCLLTIPNFRLASQNVNRLRITPARNKLR